MKRNLNDMVTRSHPTQIRSNSNHLLHFQLLSSTFVFAFYTSNLFGSIFVLSVLIGPFDLIWAYLFYTGCYFALTFGSMVALEQTVMRLLIDWYWQRLPPVNDEFFFRFLTSLNITVSLLVPFQNILAKDDLKSVLFVLGIAEVPEIHHHRLRLNWAGKLMFLVSLCFVLRTISGLVCKFKNREKMEDMNQNLNNVNKNKEMATTVTYIFLGIVILMLVGPVIVLVIEKDVSALSLEEIGLLTALTIFSYNGICPAIIFFRNKKLRLHFRQRFKDFCCTP